MPIIIVSIIAVLAIIIALCFIFTTDENKTPEEIFQECIDNIDNIKLQHSFLGINYFLYKNYEIILWIPGYVTIIDHSENKRIELSTNNEIAYQLGSLLKQKIK